MSIAGNLRVETQWEKDRCGKITASDFHLIFTEPKDAKAKAAGELSTTAKNYLYECAGEILTGTYRSVYNNALEWGHQYEPEAVEALREKYPNLTYYGNEDKKFIPFDLFSGGSPDAVDYPEDISKKITVFEVKCPEDPSNHIENLLIPTHEAFKALHKQYWYQLQFNMLCVAKERNVSFMDMTGIFVSYCPILLNSYAERNKLFTLVVPPDKEFHKQVYPTLNKAKEFLATIIDKLC